MSRHRQRIARLAAIAAIVVAPGLLRALEQSANLKKPTPVATGVIAGRVIDAATERPIAGALVVTYTDGGEVAALTNAAGQFVLEGLPDDEQRLAVSKFGYLTGRSGQSHPTGTGSGVSVAAAGRASDVVIRLWKRAAITGRVVDDRGDPIVGVRVAASRIGFQIRSDDLDEPHGGLHAETDDRGIFRFGGLVPGQYVVYVPSTQTAVPREVIALAASSTDPAERRAAGQALAASGSTWEPPGTHRGGISDGDLVRTIGSVHAASRAPSAIYPTTFYSSATTSAGAQMVSVGAGEERAGIDLIMRPAIGVRVSGRLSGTDGPVAMQALQLVHDTAGDFAPAIDPPVATTVTDASGAFTFIGVPPGQYRIMALSLPEEGETPATEFSASVATGGRSEVVMIVEAMAPARAVNSKAKPIQWARLPVSVGERDVEGFEAAYRRGFQFKGRVVFEGSGKVPEATQPWLALSIERGDGRAIGLNRWASQDPDELAVNAQGEFDTGTVPPGRYLIRVPEPPPGWQLKSAMVGGRDVADDPLDVAADVDGLVLTFTAATQVTGQVADAARITHAGVIIFPLDAARWTDIGRSPHRVRAVPVREGRFSVTGLPAGDYYVVAVRDPDRLDERNARQLQELAAVADRLVVTQGDMRPLTLRIRDVR